ncbi:virulence RhuM family protein [Anaerotalea alkaliphila]|uniref:Virulence RhuM family protein n=1 Tax=Anaerotalea alkaliphila TaxID=2662126 RepID=A0A7X5KNC3_9FIRM|nr:virulence RhuM family protein [Anaerotalea alkaliphila]NDL68719.1 virulence RhuM family protein [Anaerotalea alkaliphila]
MNSRIIMYQTEDGLTKIETNFDGDTVWLSIDQMAELFQRDKSTISRHIKNIFTEGELERHSVVANFATTATDGKNYQVDYYNLDVIISVGYRVKSLRGTQFRVWANKILKEYLKKGFAMNDDLLKNSGGGNYFQELLERIRDIRSSEKVFYRQILDIYATSIDYDPRASESIVFFKIVQNKMHFAAHGHTAAEIVYLRADADKDFMGMTAFDGKSLRKSDASIAKNYLKEDEIKILNRLVTAYLEFAELQAIRQRPMYMKDWIGKLDDFIKMSGSELLDSAGKISHEDAKIKAELEYEKYKERSNDQLTRVERDFIEHVKTAQKQLEQGKGIKGGR